MNRRILLIDDELYTMASMVDQLSDEGFTVEGVADVPQAVDALRNRQFDAIIVDCVMATGHQFLESRSAGVQLVEEIRSGAVGEWNRRVPIVVLTAVCDQATLADLNRSDVQAVFQKPVFTGELLQRLRSVLGMDVGSESDDETEDTT